MDKLRDGIDLYLAGDHHIAIRTLKEYIDEGGPSAGTAYYHIGLAYSDLQNLPQAGENLTKAVDLEPNKSMYHYRLGIVYHRLMALDKAVVHLKKSIEINPEHQRSRFILGTTYFQRGDMAEAYKTFSELLNYSPDFAAAYYSRAQCSYHLGDTDASLNDLNKAIDVNPDYNEARMGLALTCLAAGKYADALEQCVKIYKNNARDFVFLKLYISTLIHNGQLDEAKNIASEALVIYPHNAEIQDLIKDI